MATTTQSLASSCSILSPHIALQRIRIPRAFNFIHTSNFPKATTNVTVSHQFSSFGFPGKSPRDTTAIIAASSTDDSGVTSQDLAVFLEVHGVLVDAYRVGNRIAFNKAFEKLGLDCASWNEPVYSDLLRLGGLRHYPQMRRDSSQKVFCWKRFIDDAYNEGVPVVVLTAYTKSGDNIARSILEKLGNDRSKKVIIVGIKEAEQSLYGQLISGKVIAYGLDEELAKEATRAASAEKQRLAKEVASMLNLSVAIDTGLPESLDKIVTALHAGAECAGLPICNCVLVAGSHSGAVGAERVGMPCVVLRSSLTSRAEFPLAIATMDAFGGGDLTISKLRDLCQKKQPKD
ncbi:hypothetical protein KIW84_014647 [Lathyrus oleraceus]|uniref:Haloacid dehalogenase-like hydrolase domain-containing protein n=1 Tax=Pisum sativum TaxID=3888 RepID=A0A9D5BN82_PEA|nr:hypothetical protein KIW84_014647 [Pisum sativum]